MLLDSTSISVFVLDSLVGEEGIKRCSGFLNLCFLDKLVTIGVRLFFFVAGFLLMLLVT